MLLAALLPLGGCASPASDRAAAADEVTVVAAFYPLQFIAERVGGPQVTVSNLTQPGTEPHDLELSPQQVAAVGDSDLALYLSGFQPAVDDAIATVNPSDSLDVGTVVDLSLTYTPLTEAADEQSAEEGVDPHFWLDPLRLAAAADAVADELSTIAPDQAAEFARNAAELNDELADLSNEMGRGLTECRSRDVVTTHNAFGYLAAAFDLRQVGIAGLSPEAEPTPGALAAVADFVTDNDVRTIYYESLVSPEIAETLARTTGSKTAVLDPIEGLTDDSQGEDYLALMRSNLASLQQGQPCP